MRNLFDRGESLSAFLTRWYGEPDRDRRIGELDPAVPDELVTWHRDAAGREQGIAFQDYPLPPEELRRRPDGKMVFWIENQGGYEWAADLMSPTHDVFMADPDEEGERWRSTGLGLGDFLVYVTLREAIMGAEHKIFVPSLPGADAEAILRELTPLGFFPAADPDPASRLFVGTDALVEVATPPAGHPADERNVMVNLAAIDGPALERHLARIDEKHRTWGW